MPALKSHLAAGLAAAFALALSAAAALAETVIGSSFDSRVILGFKVSDAAAQARLPEGWKLLTLPKGPIAGTNLLVAFIDRHLQTDAEGKPEAAFAGRALAVMAYGVNPGVEGARLFVTGVWETPPVASSYGNGVAAAIHRELSTSGPAEGSRSHAEIWRIAPEGGGSLDMSLSYTTGRPGWSAAEAKPFSAADPEFFRIYRYDSLTDLAMSTALGKPLAGTLELSTDIEELAPLFDGSEELTAVLVVPMRVRDISLP